MFSPDHFSGQPDHETWMRIALSEARQAVEEDEVPVGAVVVAAGRIVGSAHNQREQLADPTAHAEMIALTQAASSLGSWRLVDCVLYVTLEPCAMCAGALYWAQLSRVVYSAKDPKRGFLKTGPKLHPRTILEQGPYAEESQKLLQDFFQKKR